MVTPSTRHARTPYERIRSVMRTRGRRDTTSANCDASGPPPRRSRSVRNQLNSCGFSRGRLLRVGWQRWSSRPLLLLLLLLLQLQASRACSGCAHVRSCAHQITNDYPPARPPARFLLTLLARRRPPLRSAPRLNASSNGSLLARRSPARTHLPTE